MAGTAATTAYFYPRPPRGGRPRERISSIMGISSFLSTPSARRATFLPMQGRCFPGRYFYPRPPRGGRQCQPRGSATRSIFLSTPSARRATFRYLAFESSIFYFYPRPPRGGRHEESVKKLLRRMISIHALREEGDLASRRRGRR